MEQVRRMMHESGAESGLRPPIRVLMVTSEWPTDDSGTAHFIVRQVKFLRALGVDVYVFHFRGGKKLGNYFRAWKQVRARIAQQNYDLMHAQFGQSGLLTWPKRLPLVVTFRGCDLLGVRKEKDGRKTFSGKCLQRLCQLNARRADAVILVSAHMRAYVPASAQVSIIPSGLDFDLFRCMPKEEARRRLGLPDSEHLVLFVGDPHEARKRYTLAENAVAILRRTLPARIILGWKVPHSTIPVLMNACDALIFTSCQEGSPNVVKEALACNLPVVSVRVGDVEQRLQGIAGCELCADERPETIAAGLEHVLRKGQRINGRSTVQELSEWVLTEKVIAIYRSVLETTAAPATNSRRAIGTAELVSR